MTRHDESLPMPLSPSATGVLAEARQAYIAVEASSGPHVTPDLFAWAADRIWFAAAETTLKAKVLAADTRVAVVVAVRGRAVCLSGPVRRFDPASPRDIVAAAPMATTLLSGLSTYVLRNAPDLVVFGRDFLAGRLGFGVPPRRVLFSFVPDQGLIVEGGEFRPLDGNASAATSTLPNGYPAVVAFPGPFATPARWNSTTSELHLPAELCPVPVGTETELAVVVDEFVAPGPAAKQGILLRGTGRHRSPGTIEVRVDRVVTWDGIDTDAAPVQQPTGT